jgi:hypothetical protein
MNPQWSPNIWEFFDIEEGFIWPNIKIERE